MRLRRTTGAGFISVFLSYQFVFAGSEAGRMSRDIRRNSVTIEICEQESDYVRGSAFISATGGCVTSSLLLNYLASRKGIVTNEDKLVKVSVGNAKITRI